MRALPLLLLAAVLAGCGSGAAGGGGSAETLRVFAAASLTGAFTELGEQFEADHPGTRVELNFGPSSGLSEQIASGAPADVFASADEILSAHYGRNVGSLHTTEYSPFKDDSTDPPLGIQLTAIGSRYDFFWRIRDLLLARADLREAYDALKRTHHGRPMTEYRAAKERFFAAVLHPN